MKMIHITKAGILLLLSVEIYGFSMHKSKFLEDRLSVKCSCLLSNLLSGHEMIIALKRCHLAAKIALAMARTAPN